jgi:hypothetical protein
MANYAIDITYEGAAEDGGDQTVTYSGYDEIELPVLKRIQADFKEGKLVTQLRADPRLRVVGIKAVLIREVGDQRRSPLIP